VGVGADGAEEVEGETLVRAEADDFDVAALKERHNGARSAQQRQSVRRATTFASSDAMAACTRELAKTMASCGHSKRRRRASTPCACTTSAAHVRSSAGKALTLARAGAVDEMTS
jgi:hypothetical protein